MLIERVAWRPAKTLITLTMASTFEFQILSYCIHICNENSDFRTLQCPADMLPLYMRFKGRKEWALSTNNGIIGLYKLYPGKKHYAHVNCMLVLVSHPD